MADLLLESDLKAMNVAQLKVICKDKGISGYSKANKTFLVEMIISFQTGAPIKKPPPKPKKISPVLPSTSTTNSSDSASVQSISVVAKNASEPQFAPISIDFITAAPSKDSNHSVQPCNNPILPNSSVTTVKKSIVKTMTTPKSAPQSAITSIKPAPKQKKQKPANIDYQPTKEPNRSVIEPAESETIKPTHTEPQEKTVPSASTSTRPIPPGSAFTTQLLTPAPTKRPSQDDIDRGLAKKLKTSTSTSLAQKRLAPDVTAADQPPSKQRKTVTTTVIMSPLTKNTSISNALIDKLNNIKAPKTHTSTVNKQNPTGKRFVKPLIKKHPPTLTLPTSPLSKAPKPVSETTGHHSKADGSTNTTLQEYSLDFPVFTVPQLQRISFPPKLAQRKRVLNYAVLLSGVPKEDIANCAAASRVFHYAAYLSAMCRLDNEFAGRRLDAAVGGHQVSMTDMWPYLRLREQEAISRKKKFEKSFLGKVFNGKGVIGRQLWKSVDHDHQATIAVRFLLTRLFFAISTGDNDGKMWSSGIVIDAQPIAHGEIWCIVVYQPAKDSRETFYVLEATCEVIGKPPPTPGGPQSANVPLRADWTSYVDQTISQKDNETRTLKDYLAWTNHEEYDRGISKVWSKRVEGEGRMRDAKMVVAERYVLACVVGNSVSGKWMSNTAMAQDFAGMAEAVVGKKNKQPKVQLFLPAHHLVESVHFTTSKGTALHPAVAIVQTPGREYFILKDNGMQIGSEEDGIARVWMEIIGCTNAGESVL